MKMLSEAVLHEIFDLRHKPNDVVLNHFFEDIEEYGLIVKQYFDYDHAIVIIFCRPGDHPIVGEIRVDRIRRVFDISIKVDGAVVLPASGDWGLVLEYLQKALPNNHHIH